jgi:low affinity Fe/Cu permease
MNKWFTRFAGKASDLTGSSWAFLAAVAVIVIWAVTGPVFGFSDTWQLVINTGTTIITFLMVFLIQNTQNRDAKALHLKLDEIIHVLGPAHDELLDVEDRTDEELRELIRLYRSVAKRKHNSGDSGEIAADARERRDENLQEGNRQVARNVDEEVLERELKSPGQNGSSKANGSKAPSDGSELVVSGTREVAPARDDSNRRQ